MSDWAEDALRHKYDPLPEDAPRHKKKSKKRRVRSDHKHEYEKVCVDTHSYIHRHGGRVQVYHVATRCKVCGRLGNIRSCAFYNEPPKDLPLYEVKDYIEFAWMKQLPESLRVSKGDDSRLEP